MSREAKICIGVDSTSGIYNQPDVTKEFGITPIAMSVTWDLKDGPVTMSEDQISPEIYNRNTREVMPHTAATYDKFYEFISRTLKARNFPFVLTVTSRESAAYGNALLAKRHAIYDVSVKREVTIFDSRTTSVPLLFMAEYAAGNSDNTTPKILLNELESRRGKYGVFALISDQGLEAMKFNGRGAKVVQAAMAKIIKVNPIIGFNWDGKVYTAGMNTTLRKNIQLMESLVSDIKGLTRVGIVHTGNPDLAGQVTDDMKQKLAGSNCLVENLGFAGFALEAQAGHGTIAIGFETE